MSKRERGGIYRSPAPNAAQRREQAIDMFIHEHGVNPIAASGLARGWEFEANRRGLAADEADYWRTGRAWMARALAQQPTAES